MIKEREKLPYFTISQFALSYQNRVSALVNVKNKIRQKKWYQIRKGVYTTTQKVLEYSLSGQITAFKEFIATNVIYPPSYLSLEYVLFENHILTENVYTFTLVTTKKTAEFTNHFGTFTYRSIKPAFFGEYEIIKVNGLLVYKASPEKALFDYLYFQRGIVFTESYFQELRLNIDNVDFDKFAQLVKKYPSKKLEKCFTYLQKIR
ncbi:MAG: hypothetical protein LBU27_08165 [Candidatus Peribacteria bacterium]|jgi:hypothetical protein|nr:hypothetical protein [Candidatus Peribacteria bacterium]